MIIFTGLTYRNMNREEKEDDEESILVSKEGNVYHVEFTPHNSYEPLREAPKLNERKYYFIRRIKKVKRNRLFRI